MGTETFRPLSDNESQIVRRLLEEDFPGRDELSQQLNNCRVRRIDANGSLEFQIDSKVKAGVKWRVPTEAHSPDADGIVINILLHVVDGTPKELEIYKDDNSPVIKMPELDELEIWHPGEIWD